VTQANLAAEERNGSITLPTLPVVEHSALPPLEKCVEMKDSPELFARRTSFAKTVSMFETGTNEVQMQPRYRPSVREQWVRFHGDAGARQWSSARFSISLWRLRRRHLHRRGGSDCLCELKPGPSRTGGMILMW
jgi:hypothetical protein